MTIVISFNDGTKDITTTTTKTCSDICESLNTDKFINLESAIMPTSRVQCIKVTMS